MNYLKAILVTLFVLLVIIVAVQNYSAMATKVHFRLDLGFLSYESAPMTLYLITVLSFLVGVAFTSLVGIAERFRLKRQIKTLSKEAKTKDAELNSLRNFPITTEDLAAPMADKPGLPDEINQLKESEPSRTSDVLLKSDSATISDKNEKSKKTASTS